MNFKPKSIAMKTLLLNRITFAAIAILFSTIIFSCKKESSFDDNQTEITEEEALALSDESTQTEASFDDVEDVSMLTAEEEGEASEATTGAVTGSAGTSTIRPYLVTFAELRLRIGSCATVTVVPNNNTYPKTVTIDFGDGCLGADGKFRKGAIVIHLTGPIRRSGSVMTISLRNFFLNRAHIEGTKVLSNLSENGNIKFTVQVVGGAVTFPNGRGYQYQTLKYVKQIEGGNTLPLRDDVYSIEGRSKTEFNGGKIVTFNAETPLIKKFACPWISDGVLKMTVNNFVVFANYAPTSNGECDNKVLLTWNNGNNQRLISLP